MRVRNQTKLVTKILETKSPSETIGKMQTTYGYTEEQAINAVNQVVLATEVPVRIIDPWFAQARAIYRGFKDKRTSEARKLKSQYNLRKKQYTAGA